MNSNWVPPSIPKYLEPEFEYHTAIIHCKSTRNYPLWTFFLYYEILEGFWLGKVHVLQQKRKLFSAFSCQLIDEGLQTVQQFICHTNRVDKPRKIAVRHQTVSVFYTFHPWNYGEETGHSLIKKFDRVPSRAGNPPKFWSGAGPVKITQDRSKAGFVSC